MKFIDILESHLYLNTLALPLKINDIGHRLIRFIQVTDETDNAIRLMKGNFFLRAGAPVPVQDRQIRIEIGRLMQMALDLIFLESGFLKNLLIRKEIDGGPGSSGFADDWEQLTTEEPTP